MNWKLLLPCAAAGALLSACATGESTDYLDAVDNFIPEKYMGRWYEIARLPHSFENGMEQVYATYSQNPDGTIEVINRGKKNGHAKEVRGVARLAGDEDKGELKVSFFRPFYGAYRIILLSDDYQNAAVTSDTLNYLWILSRTPVMEPETLNRILVQVRNMGFATDRLIYPDQSEHRP